MIENCWQMCKIFSQNGNLKVTWCHGHKEPQEQKIK
jgi:hypothetical protein